MGFLNLSLDMQNLYLINYSFFYKGVFVVGGLLFALVYIFYWKVERETPTIFKSVGILRMFLTILSWGHIFMFPLTLLLMSPDYSLSKFLVSFMPIYFALGIGLAVSLLIDFFYYAPSVVVRICGFNLSNPKVNKLYNDLQRRYKKLGFR